MKDSKEEMNESMKKLSDGNFQKETFPNSPPYSNVENEIILNSYKNFLNSNFGKAILNL